MVTFKDKLIGLDTNIFIYFFEENKKLLENMEDRRQKNSGMDKDLFSRYSIARSLVDSVVLQLAIFLHLWIVRSISNETGRVLYQGECIKLHPNYDIGASD